MAASHAATTRRAVDQSASALANAMSVQPVRKFSSNAKRSRLRAIPGLVVGAGLALTLVFYTGQLLATNKLAGYTPGILSKTTLPRYAVSLEPARPEFVEAVERAQDENGVVIVLSASAGYLPNVLNSMCSMKRVGIKRALMVALDSEVYRWANETNFFVPVMLPGAVEDKSSDLVKYAKPGFSKIAMEKFQSVEPVLATGKHALFLDGDIFWCHKSPVPEIMDALSQQPAGRDIIFQTSFEHLKGETPLGDYINTGLFLARPTTAVRTFFKRIGEDARAEPNLGNQRGVNNRLCKESLGGRVVYKTKGTWSFRRGEPAYCERDELQAAFLDVVRFPNGPSRTPNALTKPKRSEVRANCDAGKVAMLHNNYIEGVMKELRFKAQGLWYAAVDIKSCLSDPLPRPTEELKQCGRGCVSWLRDTSV